MPQPPEAPPLPRRAGGPWPRRGLAHGALAGGTGGGGRSPPCRLADRQPRRVRHVYAPTVCRVSIVCVCLDDRPFPHDDLYSPSTPHPHSTLLHSACRHGHRAVVSLLLARGFHVRMPPHLWRNNHGRDPFLEVVSNLHKVCFPSRLMALEKIAGRERDIRGRMLCYASPTHATPHNIHIARLSRCRLPPKAPTRPPFLRARDRPAGQRRAHGPVVRLFPWGPTPDPPPPPRRSRPHFGVFWCQIGRAGCFRLEAALFRCQIGGGG